MKGRRLLELCCSAGEVRAEPEGSEDGAGGFYFRGGHVGSGPDHRHLPPLPSAQTGWFVSQQVQDVVCCLNILKHTYTNMCKDDTCKKQGHECGL